jgi:hypothetical protein
MLGVIPLSLSTKHTTHTLCYTLSIVNCQTSPRPKAHSDGKWELPGPFGRACCDAAGAVRETIKQSCA